MMIKLRYFILSSMFTLLSIQGHDGHDKYYSSSFLTNYSQVRTALKEEGFRELYFKTPDGLRLNGLYLERPNAICNVIVCAGWLPGRKEKMATFFSLLPDYCNILLFDARGHGKSEGPLFREVWRYGVNEYKDILGAIYYSYGVNQLPIVVCGICAGAFNATHAVVNLQDKELLQKYNVKGLVFDSGWGSIASISRTVFIGNNEIPIVKLVKKICRIHKLHNVRQSLLYKCLFFPIRKIVNVAHKLFIYPIIKQHELLTNLFDKIHRIEIPLFFIHSYNDLHADIDSAQHLASLVSNKQTWWIEDGSYHAWHHLKHKDAYKEKIKSFIDHALAQ